MSAAVNPEKQEGLYVPGKRALVQPGWKAMASLVS